MRFMREDEELIRGRGLRRVWPALLGALLIGGYGAPAVAHVAAVTAGAARDASARRLAVHDQLWGQNLHRVVARDAPARRLAAHPRGTEAVAPDPVYTYAPPPLRAASAALLDVTTGRWLLLDNADVPRAQASTAKIMTALVAVTRGTLDEGITAGADAVAVGRQSGSNMGLVAGETLPLRDLLYGLLLPSGNDAALSIAAGVGGSTTAFVDLMNGQAAALGLAHTHFANPDGLDAPGQYASARDLVLLARAAMRDPLLRQVVATPAYTIPATGPRPAHALTNLNWFLDWYPGADGVKPGMTGDAGLCQVVSARRHGHWLIGAVMDTPDLHTDVRDLMNYGFGDFTWSPSGQSGDDAGATVAGGAPADPSLYSPATGHAVRAGFLSYYLRHGGMAALGPPRTDEIVEGGRTVQYFANARLWWDDAARAAVATPLGQAAVPAPQLLRPVAPAAATPTRIYIPVTGHTVQAAILATYRAWGGAATLGYPLTEEILRGDETTQYFSNAVLRWSPERPVVTADPLGDALLRRRGLLRG